MRKREQKTCECGERVPIGRDGGREREKEREREREIALSLSLSLTNQSISYNFMNIVIMMTL
jgi:uncharacterized protein Veg